MYQGMVAIFASTLILGAYIERIKFGAFILFTLLWTTVVFDPDRSLDLGRGRVCCGWAGCLISQAVPLSM